MDSQNKQNIIRWGILGTGVIAKQFAEALTLLPDAQLAAVGSRNITTAKAFAEKYEVSNAYSSYEELSNDPNVDVVYIATPHTSHKNNILLCLNAGKGVLCEKPFTINADEAEEVISLARRNKLFLMEAMWTRYFPLIHKVRELIDNKEIGELQLLTADFGFKAPNDPEGRFFNLELGGGALLDLGIYTISLAFMIFGKPSFVTGTAHIGKTKVDEQSAVILGYERGPLAILGCSLVVDSTREANIIGTNGKIRIHSPFWKPSVMTLTTKQKKEEVLNIPFNGNGLNYEASEVMNCLRTGKAESDIMPLDETLEILKTTDQIRFLWGLRYPND
jgi:dihydrodiol dehydrogenase / D-xylose 1-dehydrogenase (NADP)